MNRPSSYKRTILAAIASFGSLIDVHPRAVRRVAIVAKSPSEAMRGDWVKLGGDMSRSLRRERDGVGS